MIETDTLVIGAGPAGLFQVFELGLLEIGAHVVDSLHVPGGQLIELYPDKPIYDIPGIPACSARELVDNLLKQVEPFKPQLHLGQEVASLERQDDGRLLVGTSAGTTFLAKAVVIAGGVGSFQPRRLALPGLERHFDTQVFHGLRSLEPFAGRDVVVAGGVDAALDAALTLTEPGPHRARSVTLLHRRDAFQAEEETVARVRDRIAQGQLRLVIGQPQGFDGRQLTVLTPDGQPLTIETEAWLAYPGISPRLGPIADWGLQLAKKQLPVDTEKYQTGEAGVFAVGDVNTYPGKKKLIVCGFHEATLAAWGAAALVFPEKAIPLQYTTTSTRLHELLGVSHP